MMDITDKRILVAGGAGFLGSHLSRALLERGADVRIVDNLFGGDKEHVPDGAKLIEQDIYADDIGSTLQEYDPHGIVHLAAVHYVPYCTENPGEAFDANVVGTRRLLKAAEDLHNLETVVYSSTASVYPPRTKPNREDSEAGPINIYGRTKLVCEDLVELFQHRTGVPSVSARLFNIYGPGETHSHLIPAILDQVEDGEREIELGNLTPERDFIYVTDVAEALISILEDSNESYRTYNVGTGKTHSVREVVESVGEALKEDINIVQDPDRVREAENPHVQADIERIRREIGWEPTVDFVTGLRRLLAERGIVDDRTA
jgi:UDP-glucose 4-epimerase